MWCTGQTPQDRTQGVPVGAETAASIGAGGTIAVAVGFISMRRLPQLRPESDEDPAAEFGPGMPIDRLVGVNRTK